MSAKDKTYHLGLANLTQSQSGHGASTQHHRWLARKLLEICGNPPIAIILWDDVAIQLVENPVAGKMRVRTPAALYRLFKNPSLEFGDHFVAGAVDVEGDLVRFLEAIYRASDNAPSGFLRSLIARILERPLPNTLHRSRTNIHHHYDIGNEFYSRWLDREVMQYTCAYFPEPEMALEAAQTAKLDHVARKLQLKPGDTVVEAGCGWGGLARYFASHYGVKVHAYNISHEQVVYATARARELGLGNQVKYVEDDYRNISGDYDAFVSVGMLEHVGVGNYRQLGSVIDRCLKDNGLGLIHSIGRNKSRFMHGWIEKRIFPGAYPPTLREAMEIFEPYEFSVLDVENLRLHYARTLQYWLERYDSQRTWVEREFDKAFYRAWRLYLAGSIAGFTTGSLQLFQIVFARQKNNDLPWSRSHIYKA